MYTHEQIDGYHALRLHVIVRGTNPGVTTVYAFANMVTPPSEYGIAMYNPDGEMIYHGEMMLLDAKLIPVDIKLKRTLDIHAQSCLHWSGIITGKELLMIDRFIPHPLVLQEIKYIPVSIIPVVQHGIFESRI